MRLVRADPRDHRKDIAEVVAVRPLTLAGCRRTGNALSRPRSRTTAGDIAVIDVVSFRSTPHSGSEKTFLQTFARVQLATADALGVHPPLTKLLRRDLDSFGVIADGRLFRSVSKRGGDLSDGV